MGKPVRLTCPLGHTCQTETEDVIVRCNWYTQIRGNNPQDGKEVDEWGLCNELAPRPFDREQPANKAIRGGYRVF